MKIDQQRYYRCLCPKHFLQLVELNYFFLPNDRFVSIDSVCSIETCFEISTSMFNPHLQTSESIFRFPHGEFVN